MPPGGQIAPRPRALRHRCHEENPAPRGLRNDGTTVALSMPSTTLAPASGAPEATNRTETPAMNFPALRTTQKQQHTVTPRLQHAVRLLQLSSLDFAQEVHDAMGRNPFLEVEDAGARRRARRGRRRWRRGRPEDRRRRRPARAGRRFAVRARQLAAVVVERAHPGRGERPQRPRPDRRRRRPAPAPAHPDQRPAARSARPRPRLRDHRIARRRRLPAHLARGDRRHPRHAARGRRRRDADRAQAGAVARPLRRRRAQRLGVPAAPGRHHRRPRRARGGAPDRHRPSRPAGPARRQRPRPAAEEDAGGDRGGLRAHPPPQPAARAGPSIRRPPSTSPPTCWCARSAAAGRRR